MKIGWVETLLPTQIYGNSSVGRASVSKTEGREFESYFPCQIANDMFDSFKKYCKESYEELVNQTTWPTRSELMNSAVVVLTASLCIALVVFVMDFVFQSGMEVIYGLLR